MITIYKAMDADNTTRHEDDVMRWGYGVTNCATGPDTELCTDGVIHGYRTPLQAAFMLPAYAPRYKVLRRAETPEIVADDGTKIGGKVFTTYETVPLPEITSDQRVEVVIRVSLLVYHDEGYVQWAERWLSGEDRTAAAAESAAERATAAESAAWAVAESAKLVAESAKLAAAYAAARAEPATIDLCAILEQVCGEAKR